jgi:hypothetical protein
MTDIDDMSEWPEAARRARAVTPTAGAAAPGRRVTGRAEARRREAA